MSFDFYHLDPTTRRYMIDELEYDLARDALYLSPRLSTEGREVYPELLRSALESGDDTTFADALRESGRFNTHETAVRRGKSFSRKVPVTAPETLSEGEFNRFYARALCRRAIDEGPDRLVIYRAKEVSNPRAESTTMLGQEIDPEALLADLRSHVGVDTALGLPPGPNSGLSVRFR